MLDVRYIFDYQNKPVNEYTLKNGKYQISVINLGAAITKLIVPNKNEKLENILLRYYDYKLYKENKYLLGCLLDYDAFQVINHYFECELDEHSLIFSFKEENQYIKVKYTLNENYFQIDYENNVGLNLANVLFLNLSGNLKEDILSHQCSIFNQRMDFKMENITFNKLNGSNDKELVTIKHPNNRIKIAVYANTNELYYSLGHYFNQEFYLNKQTQAQLYSGIGLVISSNSICIQFEI